MILLFPITMEWIKNNLERAMEVDETSMAIQTKLEA